MSAPGPESIPVSADPRSKRPVKKRALTPVSAQASQLDSLFARPDQDIRIPTTSSSSDAANKRRLPLPPEIVTNVQGSSAGAGSGEFHVYKAARRREYERLRVMDEENRREEGQKEFEDKRREKEEEDKRKTERNRAKREKMKARKEKAKADKKGGGKSADGATPAAGGGIKARPAGTRDDQEGGHGTNGNMDVDTKVGPTESQGAAADTPGLLIHDDD